MTLAGESPAVLKHFLPSFLHSRPLRDASWGVSRRAKTFPSFLPSYTPGRSVTLAGESPAVLKHFLPSFLHSRPLRDASWGVSRRAKTFPSFLPTLQAAP